MSALACWSLSVVLEHYYPGLTLKIFWMKMSYLGITIVPTAWLVFTLQYTHHESWLTRRKLFVFCIIPALALIVVWTNDFHHLWWGDIWLDTTISPPIDAVTHNVLFWIYTTYAYIIIIASNFILLKTFIKSTGIYRSQISTMLLASFVPWIANFMYVFKIGPFSKVDPTPLAFAITGVTLYWGLSRLQLLRIIPIAYETIFRSVQDAAIVLDKNNRILELNPSAEKLIWQKLTNIIGMPYRQVMPGLAAHIEPDTKVPDDRALIGISQGKSLRYFGISFSPIFSKGQICGHLVFFHDETEQRKAELDTRERVRLEAELTERDRVTEIIKRRLEIETVISKISSRFVGDYEISPAINQSLEDIGLLTKANRAYVFLFNRESPTMDNTNEWCAEGVKPQIELLQGLSCELFPWWIGTLKNGRIINIPDVNNIPPEGNKEKEILLIQDIKSILVLPLHVSGELVGFVGLDNVDRSAEWNDSDIGILHMCTDIIGNAIGRKRAETELTELNNRLKTFNLELEEKVTERTKELQTAVQAADAANKAKSDFLASMSHELRTPLTAIIGFSQLLDERYFGELNEKQSEYVKDILTSSNHLLDLINDVLDLAKVQAGKMDLEISPVNVKDLQDRSLIMIKEKAVKHGIEIQNNSQDCINGLVISADMRKLKQVMFNLLSNAVKFTQDGGCISIDSSLEGDYLVMSVSDTGIGISLENQKKLFQEFFQVKSGAVDKTPGTGLGLAITKRIIELHGGRIWAESAGENCGSKFTFTIPAKPIKEENKYQESPPVIFLR
jgi:PAS domain S-box-containing protein